MLNFWAVALSRLKVLFVVISTPPYSGAHILLQGLDGAYFICMHTLQYNYNSNTSINIVSSCRPIQNAMYSPADHFCQP